MYQSIFENIQVGLHIYHMEDINDDKTLRMIHANQASAEFEMILKIGEDELIVPHGIFFLTFSRWQLKKWVTPWEIFMMGLLCCWKNLNALTSA